MAVTFGCPLVGTYNELCGKHLKVGQRAYATDGQSADPHEGTNWKTGALDENGNLMAYGNLKWDTNMGGDNETPDLSNYCTKEEIERLQYYGDKDIVPSPEEWFVFDDVVNAITDINIEGMQDIEKIVVPYKIQNVFVEKIGDGTNPIIDKNVSKIILPKTLKEIESYCFKNLQCKQINIPRDCIKIGEEAFSSLEFEINIVVEDGENIELGNNVFAYNLNPMTINLNNLFKRITQIPAGTFLSASYLPKEITIPEHITKIGTSAFYTQYEELNTAIILNSLCEIEEEAFNTSNDYPPDFFTIKNIICNPGSTAEAYAKANGIKYAYNYIDPTSINSGSDEIFTLACDIEENPDGGLKAINLSAGYKEVYSAYEKGKTIKAIGNTWDNRTFILNLVGFIDEIFIFSGTLDIIAFTLYLYNNDNAEAYFQNLQINENMISTIEGNESIEDYYPSVKAVADYVAKYGGNVDLSDYFTKDDVTKVIDFQIQNVYDAINSEVKIIDREKEDVSNKTDTISDTPSMDKYPSEVAVFEKFMSFGNDIKSYIFSYTTSKFYTKDQTDNKISDAIGDVETSLENIIAKYGLGGDAS